MSSGEKPDKRKKRKPGALEVGSLRLGRYPFRAGIAPYVERMQGRWRGRTTKQEEVRKLRQLADIFELLKDAGKIKSTDPRHLRQEDIQKFLVHISGLDPDSQRRHILKKW